MKNIIKKVKSSIKKTLYKISYLKYKNKCKKNGKKEFIIFNTPLHGNIGDHAIIAAEQELLDTMGVEAFEVSTYGNSEYIFDFLKENISNSAIVSITGGGFIGSQWIEEEKLVNKVLENFKNNKIIIFPATFYFKDDEQGREELRISKALISEVKDITIFAREEKTFEFLNKEYDNAKNILIPDIVLNLKRQFNAQRDYVLLCLRSDVEGNLKNDDKSKIEELIPKEEKVLKTDTVVNYAISEKNRKKELNNKILEFAKSKLVITDRLHGMIFAAITNTPCIVLGNYNYKVKGVYKNWIKDNVNNIVFVENIDDIQENISKLINNYNTDKFELNFNKLTEVIEESING